MIDLAPRHLEIVRNILRRHVPGREVRAFGSRVNGTARRHSDLDLAVMGQRVLEPDTLRLLQEAFEESELPLRVDVLDWHDISESFRRVIEKEYEMVQEKSRV